MARKNSLEIRPVQEAEPARRIRARREPLSRPNETGETDTEDNGEISRSSEHESVQYNGSVDTGSQNGELVSADAEGIAVLINSASLSGINVPGINAVHKPSEETRGWSFRVKDMFKWRPQNLKGSPSGDKNTTSQLSELQSQNQYSQLPTEENLDKSAVPNGNRLNSSGSIARPTAINEDLPKVDRPRRSGLPDPFDFPQTPPKGPASERESVPTRLRGLKSKRVILGGKAEQAVEIVEGALATPDTSLVPLQHTQKATDGAMQNKLAQEVQNKRPTHITRSTRTNAPGNLEEIQRQREIYRHKATKETQKPLKFLSPTQSWSPVDNSQFGEHDTENQAGLAVSDIVNAQDSSQVFSGPRTRSKYKSSVIDILDTHPKEIDQETATKLPPRMEGFDHHHDQSEILGIGRITSDPTPAKDIRKSSRPLSRPSQQQPVPRSAKDLKLVNPSQKSTREHLSSRPAGASISEGTQNEASEQDSNTRNERISNRKPTRSANFSSGSGATSFISEETLQTLNRSIENIFKGEAKSAVKAGKCLTKETRHLKTGLTRLVSKYEAMKNLRSENEVNLGKINEEHTRALSYLEVIHKLSVDMETNQLGNQSLEVEHSDGHSRSLLVQDLYIHIIPSLVEALNSAVQSRQDLKVLEVSDLEEFYTIVRILQGLVKALEPDYESIRGGAPRTKTYSIYQPTRKFRADLRKLYDECGKKLAAHMVASRQEKLRRALPDRAKKRKERLEAEKRHEEEEFQQRLRERNKAIISSLNERRVELGLPPCGQSISDPVAGQQSQNSRYVIIEPPNNIDHDRHERLTGVFGTKNSNSHPGTTPKEWTGDEMRILVDGLRRERGPSRYEKLATKLERTLDEIFERAKYLKIQMEYTLKRLQEEKPDEEFPVIKPWIENIGSEGFLSQSVSHI